jgi:MOSC domain-containing protein YiiM
MSAVVEQIWIKRGKRAPMDPVQGATLVAGRGIAGNSNQGGKRQVTILSAAHWEENTRHLPDVQPMMRRANLLVSDIDFDRHSPGRVLRVGATRIRIFGETRPCERMDEACDGLRAALSGPWGGGAFGEVIEGGEIAVGDPVHWDSA